MNKLNRFQQLSNSPRKIKAKQPIIVMEGFSDPADVAWMSLSLEGVKVISTETQQIDEELVKEVVQSIFLFDNSKPDIFTLGSKMIEASKEPERTIFILKEEDLDCLGEDAAPTKNIVTILRNQKVGIFNTIDEAKDHIQSQLNADPLKENEENVNSDDLVNTH